MGSPLIHAQDLDDARIRQFVCLDASINLPGHNVDYRALFRRQALPRAQRFDLDVCVDQSSDLPHMLPPPQQYAAYMCALGVANDDCLLFYDQIGSMGACRAWWMSKAFGHRQSFVLDGGLLNFAALHYVDASVPRDVGEKPKVDLPPYEAKVVTHRVADREIVALASKDAGQIILDARSEARFLAKITEPRPGVIAGHIDGSVNLPYTRVLNENGFFLDVIALRSLFSSCGVPPRRPVTTCGSGLTAATLTVALAHAGLPEGRLYDGSWAEWGAMERHL